jgi:hypothetical protein
VEVVVGSVSTAVDEALRLTKIARSVKLVNHANMTWIGGGVAYYASVLEKGGSWKREM